MKGLKRGVGPPGYAGIWVYVGGLEDGPGVLKKLALTPNGEDPKAGLVGAGGAEGVTFGVADGVLDGVADGPPPPLLFEPLLLTLQSLESESHSSSCIFFLI